MERAAHARDIVGQEDKSIRAENIGEVEFETEYDAELVLRLLLQKDRDQLFGGLTTANFYSEQRNKAEHADLGCHPGCFLGAIVL